jgi:hypothetical protein
MMKNGRKNTRPSSSICQKFRLSPGALMYYNYIWLFVKKKASFPEINGIKK